MTFSIAALPWLPEAPADLSSRLRALVPDGIPPGSELQRLASHRITASQASVFRRTVEKLRRGGADLAPLSRLKLAIVSNATVDFLADHIVPAAARHGVAVELFTPDFDQVMQEALDPDSATNIFRPDAVLLAVDHRWLGLDRPRLDDPVEALDRGLNLLFEAARGFRDRGDAAPILPLLARPAAPLFGSFDRRVGGSVGAMIERANDAILEFAASEGAYVLDVDSIASRVGSDRWFDPVAWAAHKAPFAPEFNAIVADRLASLLGTIRGKSRKCLVLDLDNTCWGGAIGDEGLDGIVLGSGSAQGEAFLGVQRAALDLKARGIILAVASKNNDDVARSAFRDHNEMLLREQDIAVFQANWTDKAANLEAIAKSLSIGLDSLVLLDDNPAERAFVRAAVPSVAVPELPSDPAWFAWHLLSAGYFEATSFNADDALRAASYAQNAKRATVMATARDTGDYLRSLDMELSVKPFDGGGRARITQLINKTNQFNLLTNRYTEQQVATMEADPSLVTVQARLSDSFGDMGMIGVIACRTEAEEAEVTDWLMSCRVLGRKVEEAMHVSLVNALRRRGIARIRASYRPTRKNNMVREHFDRLGWSLVREDEDGSRHYEVEVNGVEAGDLPLALKGIEEL
ncbi:MAG TPA: HAD-IIIC family phosphatase [Sphingomicrobium sp.]|nr:HAD-IIIC family phosphatase [Sphingomicrobium sp.]